jgi:DNA polymerase (family X)
VTDREIATRLRAIADILEIQGELVFKVRAYRVAAETIDSLEDDELSERHVAGTLKELSGFGPAIVSKTSDFLTSGTTAIWERIKDAVPPGIVQLASIPGIGPKTAKTLWESLSAETIEAVEQAARDEKIRVLAGFGPAKEAQIIEKIEAWRRLSAKIPRYKALEIANRAISEIQKIPGVESVEIVGDLKAGCDETDEITLHVSCQMDYIYSIREKATYLHPIKLYFPVFMINEGYAKNISLPSPEEQAAYNALTPKELEERRAQQQADHEKWRADLDRRLKFMPLVPLEMKHWPDALDLAEAGTLPTLIERSDFRGELHEHTVWSDGKNTVREMAEAALGLGYEYLAITDHSPLVGVANGLNRDRLLQQIDEINSLKPEFAARGLQLLTGQEVDILADGSLDMDDDVLVQLDVVVASVHRRFKLDEAAMTARIVRALENPYVDILGHPTGRLLGVREPYAVDMDAVIAAAAKNNKALEINSTPERMDLKDTHAKAAKAAGVKLSINCDAHTIHSLGDFEWGLCMARRAGLEAGDVINTYSWEKLKAWLDR